MNVFIADIQGKNAILTEEESWHCAKVLRKKMGDKIRLIDGRGNFFDGTLELVSEKKCLVKVTAGPIAQEPRNYFLHLAIAPAKQLDRTEWLIEKAVEIGIDEISFFSSKNSERKTIKEERMRKIAESAVKQSLQAFLPKINNLVSFDEMVKSSTDQKLIAHCFDLPKKEIKTIDFKNRSTLVMLGPEGDFTEAEVGSAVKQGFQGISLGKNRLRAETAALYVCQGASILS